MVEDTLGELEEAVLLGIIAEGSHAFALEVGKTVELGTGRSLSRGAFPTTLERLWRKGFVDREQSGPEDPRREGTQRRFWVTARGMQAKRATKAELQRRWSCPERVLEES